MKTKIINLDELPDFLEFVELERDLKVRLTILKDHQEYVLKQLEKIKIISKKLALLKIKNKKLKYDDELRPIINKHTRWGI